MPEMTPEERAVKALKDVYGCEAHDGRLFECKGCIQAVLNVAAHAETDEKERCAKVAREQPSCGLCVSHGFDGNHGASTAAAIERGPE